jgi:nucleoside-diphosphate-sugar epimerase
MLSEDSELDGSSVYAAAKIAAEKVIKELSLPSNVQCFVVRMANVYGPESGKDTLFGTILSQAANDKDVITLRDLRPRNDFVYIEDVVRCFEKLIGSKGDEKFFLYNVSCGCSHSALEIAEKVCKEMKMREKPIKGVLAKGDVQERILSNKKIRHEINWTPEYSIDRGIKESIVKKTGVCS